MLDCSHYGFAPADQAQLFGPVTTDELADLESQKFISLAFVEHILGGGWGIYANLLPALLLGTRQKWNSNALLGPFAI